MAFSQLMKIQKKAIVKNINVAIESIFHGVVTESPLLSKENLSLVVKVEEGEAVAILLHNNEDQPFELTKEPLAFAIELMSSPEQVAKAKKMLGADSINTMLCTMLGQRVFCVEYEDEPIYYEFKAGKVEKLDLEEFVLSIRL